VEKLVENHSPIAAAAASNREFHHDGALGCHRKNETL
jgi:hypothetical protein